MTYIVALADVSVTEWRTTTDHQKAAYDATSHSLMLVLLNGGHIAFLGVFE